MKPIVVNNSKVPLILGWFFPMPMYATTIWPFIFCIEEIDEYTLNHESIHIAQYAETLVIGFLLIYLFDFIHGCIKYRGDLSGVKHHRKDFDNLATKSYYRQRAEQEAYDHDQDLNYLQNRKKYSWLKDYKV